MSWKHTRFHCLHQLLTRHSALNSVLVTGSYYSADCDTNHAHVFNKVHLQPCNSTTPSLKVTLALTLLKVEEFMSTLDQALQELPKHNARAKWNAMKDSIYSTAMSTLGKMNCPARTGSTLTSCGWNQQSRPNGKPSWPTRNTQVKAL